MSTPYEITITMDQPTVEDLTRDGYSLYGFKAVKASTNGAPLVWFATKEFGLNTSLNWTEQYEAYTTDGQAIPSGHVTATNAYPIGLDQTLDVNSPDGTGAVNVNQGTPLAISINNVTQQQFTAGISQLQPNTSAASPMCAFDLFGGNLDVIVPIEKVLLMFSTTPVNTGTVIEQAYSDGLVIDLTGDNSRSVSFDINKGWDWGGGNWGTPVSAHESVVPLLIENDSTLGS